MQHLRGTGLRFYSGRRLGVRAGQPSTPLFLDGRVSKSRVQLGACLALDDIKFIRTPASSISLRFIYTQPRFRKGLEAVTHFLGRRCHWADVGADPPAAQAGPSLGPAGWGLSSHHRCRARPTGQKWGFRAQQGGGAEGTGSGRSPYAGAQGWPGCGSEMGRAGQGNVPSARPAHLRPSAPHHRPLRSEPPSSLHPTEPGPRGPGVPAGSASSPGLLGVRADSSHPHVHSVMATSVNSLRPLLQDHVLPRILWNSVSLSRQFGEAGTLPTLMPTALI